MELFKRLFGIEAEAVQSTCIVMPSVTGKILREFGVDKLSRGEIYGSGTGRFCSLFHTRMGSVFTGDAVLYLAHTPCRELYFLGTCGLLRENSELKIGALVSPSLCYAQESFTSLLSDSTSIGIPSLADQLLLRGLVSFRGGDGSRSGDFSPPRKKDFFGEVVNHERLPLSRWDLPPAGHLSGTAAAASAISPGDQMLITEVTGISAGSLKLQEEKIGEWGERGIQVVDLESAAFLAAARQVKISAAALMVVSDVVEERPWYQQDNREFVSESLQKAARILCEIISRK